MRGGEESRRGARAAQASERTDESGGTKEGLKENNRKDSSNWRNT